MNEDGEVGAWKGGIAEPGEIQQFALSQLAPLLRPAANVLSSGGVNVLNALGELLIIGRRQKRRLEQIVESSEQSQQGDHVLIRGILRGREREGAGMGVSITTDVDETQISRYKSTHVNTRPLPHTLLLPHRRCD